MSEQSGTDSTITSKVPGEQELRGDYIHELQNEQENGVAVKYSVSPVIKVTKEESTFTKGDLKVDKVVVSEDISDETANTNRLTITKLTSPTEVQTEVYSEVSSVTINTESETQTNTGDQKVVYKITKIPKLKFKQVVKKIKKEEGMIKGKDEADLGLKVAEAIPNLKEEKNLLQEVSRSNSIQQDSPKVDDEFDRIYDEIFENGPPSGNFPSPGKIEDPDKLDTKFEEIIHAYDEQKAQATNAEKVKSKIPLLKRKSEQDIFAAKRTITKNSLKKRNSVDDTKCKLPVPFTREKQNVELESQNKKTVSAKNVTVFETVDTNISKSITTTLSQKNSERNITQKTESISDVSKSKIATHLKNIVVVEKVSDTKNSKISSQLNIEKKSEDIFINAVNKNETQEQKTVAKEEVKTLNDISNIKTESLIVKDYVEKVLNDNNKKDTTNIIVEKDIANRNPVTETETKTHIVTKVDVNILKSTNDTTQIKKPLDLKNSNNYLHETNKHSENNFTKTVQKIQVNEPNSNVSINQEVRETVRILSSQFSNSETNNIQQDQKNKISDKIVTKNITSQEHLNKSENNKEIINSTAVDTKQDKAILITNQQSVAKLQPQELTLKVTKNITSQEHLNKSENNKEIINSTAVDTKQDKAILITNQQSVAKLQPQELTLKVTKNITSQEHLNKSENNKEIINTTAVDTKQDKAILITNQQSVAKLQPQELTLKVTKNITSQEHLNKSENNKEIINSTAVDTKQDKAILITNQQSVAKLQPQELTLKVTKNITSQEHLNKSENNKEIINSTAVDTKQDKAILITNQQSVAKLQPQELTLKVTKNITSQEHLNKSENNKEIINTTAVDTKQDKAILITNQQSVAKLQPQELTLKVTKNITSQEHLNKSENNKEIINTTAVDTKQDKAILITNQQSVAKLQPQELTLKVTKNITSQENLNKSENKKEIIHSTAVDTKQDKAILITNQQSVAKLQPQELTLKVTKNITSQEHLNKSENNKEIINSTAVDTKQDKAILITNQQSVAKLQPQELTLKVTKNITSQEHLNKSENNKEIINTTAVDTKQDKAILITNQQSVAKLQPQELTLKVTKNITSQEHLNKSENNKEIINTTAVDTKQDKAILITNQQSVAKLQPQELTLKVTKNITSQENLNKSENKKEIIHSTAVDTKQDKAILITNQQSVAKLQPQELTLKVTKNITSQEHLSKSENNKEIINSTAVDTKQDKAILITNQQSVAKLQPQELTLKVTKNITSQEHLNKSENKKEIINTTAVDTKQDKAILITNQQSVAKLQPQELTLKVTKNITSQEHLNKSENNKEIINSTAVDTKQDKAILITNQQSVAKLQPQELTKEVTKNITSQEHPSKSETISKKITTEINNNETKTEVVKDNKEIKVIVSNKKEDNGEDNIKLEEEDIIILKGKVNRIISRLDSKEFKVNKCELEDLPLEESVVSKIALFEQSNSVDTAQKASPTKNKLADEINLDKPKIVDEVLKSENRSLPSDSKFSYDTFLNYKKTIKNNSSVNENKVQTISKAKSITKFDEIYNYNINLNKFDKSDQNKVESTEDDVFFKNEKANRNIINEYKMNKEIDLDMRRARSLAELNFDGVHGRVRQMVVRMNSIDKMALERREQNEVRRKTRHGSVSERIALFEQDANESTVHLMKKVTPIRMESVSTTTSSPKPEEPEPALTEEELALRITELAQARVTYGHYDNMTYIELSDGGRLPSLTVGTALLDSQLVKPIIKAAIDLGFRAIDTAYIYGNEQAIGEAIREKIQDGTVKREELFVLSKLWSTNHRQDLVLRACRQSLDIMGLDYFDLYLIHNPMSFKEGPNPVPKIANVLQYSEHDYLEAWFGIETLIKQGLVKRGGVSNFNSVQLERVLDKGKIKPVVNQVECHPYLSQTRLQDYMSSRGMAMSCFGSLGSSGTPRAFRSSLPPVINDPLVRTMAAGLGVTPAQLLISYQVLLGRSVVAKASNAAHLWDNLRALSLRLEPAHAAGLAALNRNKRTFTFEGMGDTHKNYPFKIPF